MSLFGVRSLFRERLEGLGFEEHDQPFQPNQIGETVVDGSFHLSTGTITTGPANQRSHSFSFPINVKVYKRGFVDLLEAYDDIHQTADAVLADLLSPTVRLGSPGILDIVPDSIEIQPIDETNDNIMYVELSFTAKLELCY